MAPDGNGPERAQNAQNTAVCGVLRPVAGGTGPVPHSQGGTKVRKDVLHNGATFSGWHRMATAPNEPKTRKIRPFGAF